MNKTETTSIVLSSLGQVLYTLMYQHKEDALYFLTQALVIVEAMESGQDLVLSSALNTAINKPSVLIEASLPTTDEIMV